MGWNYSCTVYAIEKCYAHVQIARKRKQSERARERERWERREREIKSTLTRRQISHEHMLQRRNKPFEQIYNLIDWLKTALRLLSKTSRLKGTESKKKAVSENRWFCRVSARSCCPLPARAHTHTHTSLSLFVRLLGFSVRQASRGAALSVKQQILYCFSSFIWCKYSRNHSTDIVFILCVFDYIGWRLDYQDFCSD